MAYPNEYLPILKWKRGEQRALKALKDEDKEVITPLIELVMPKPSSMYKDVKKKVKKTPDEMFLEGVQKLKEVKVKEIPNEIESCWGTKKILVDFTLLYEGPRTTQLKIDSMGSILRSGQEKGLHIVPVINLNDEVEIKKEASELTKKYSDGLCVRILSSDMENVSVLNEKLGHLLSIIDTKETDVDLIIDLKDMPHDDLNYIRIVNTGQKINNLHLWRNLIIANGAFPVDLSKCDFKEPTYIPRSDWQDWFSYVYSKKLERPYLYSDYTIRNPIFRDSHQFHPPTTSICYGLEDNWFIMKGKRLDYKLYLANAKLLVESSGHYYGEEFSAADQFIKQKADHYEAYMKKPSLKGTGGSEDWIYVGINHHITVTARQLSNLS